MSYQDEDYPDYVEFQMKVRTARKDYVCANCGLPIPKGEKYAVRAGKYEGEIISSKNHFDSGICHDELWKEVED